MITNISINTSRYGELPIFDMPQDLHIYYRLDSHLKWETVRTVYRYEVTPYLEGHKETLLPQVEGWLHFPQELKEQGTLCLTVAPIAYRYDGWSGGLVFVPHRFGDALEGRDPVELVKAVISPPGPDTACP